MRPQPPPRLVLHNTSGAPCGPVLHNGPGKICLAGLSDITRHGPYNKLVVTMYLKHEESIIGTQMWDRRRYPF
ncbi:hypothetical protein NDU88_003948 [Pleurodeles waltl]|uniref:Uncharacterized protein n=1 Tax=Pleurodeles waltl TaxID=8319 RepID=A0AAV7PCL9_PLEWA|nr:hypothetical protein NDU88_003948 [Pleurodeles waltl]